MAVIDGVLMLPTDAGVTNVHLSLGLHDFAYYDWPRAPLNSTVTHDAVCGAFPYVDNTPVAANGQAVAGVVPTSYFDDFYNRIHVIPAALALGNVVSTQVRVVDIWNAWLVDQTLTAITGGGEGLSISGPAVFPMTFAPLQMSTWEVSVTPGGPAVVDVIYTWVFTGLADVTLGIAGNRVVAWTLAPDWADGVEETLEFSTDVLTSRSGAEQRRALRVSPRKVFKVVALPEGRERALADNALHGWGGRLWAVPIWPDIQRLGAPLVAGATSIPCATAYRDFKVGYLALLRSESAFTYETAEITAVNADSLTLARPTLQAWPAGTRLYPMHVARLTRQPRFKRFTDRAWRLDCEFITVDACDWDALAFATTYRSHPVLATRPDETEDLTGTYERLLAVLDNGVGAPYTVDTAAAGFMLQSHRWVLDGAAERDTFRRLLYALRGRQVSVWVPTHAEDLVVASVVADSATSLQIENIGFKRYGFGEVGRRDLRLEMRNGTVYHRRITGAAEISDDLESITIDTPLGVTYQPGDFARISFLRLMRSDEDRTTIQHLTDLEGVAKATITFRTIRDEL